MTTETLWSPEIRNVVESVRRVLFKTLDDLDGDKTIVWDNRQNLMKRVNLFTGPKVLESHGVKANISLDKHSPSPTPYLVFILSPTLDSLEALCQFMDKSRNDTKTLYVVVFIPEASYIVREKLKDRDGGKYWERLESVKEVPLWWLPRDGDALSLNEPQIPSRLLINGDWTYKDRCAVALNQLLSLVPAKIPIYSKGDWAADIARMVTKMRNSAIEDTPSAGGLRLNRLVIISRWLDPLTPLLTQLTYSGLLDELYGVGMMGSIKIPMAEFEEKDKDIDPFEMKEIYLNDEIYYRLRHVHINAVASEFGAILAEARKDEITDADREKMSIAEYKVLIKKLPEITQRKKYCNIHMRLTEMVKGQLYETIVDRVKVEKELLEKSNSDRVLSFIEDGIIEAMDLTVVLRLIAIHSLTAEGLHKSTLDNYRRLVMQSYGVDGVNRMIKMQKMGLLKEKNGSKFIPDQRSGAEAFHFAHQKKSHGLLVEDVRESDRNDPAYAYSGYCSLLVKLLAKGDEVKWNGWTKYGEHGGLDDDRTAVFVVGGVTRAEMALIRQLPNVSLVMTTAVVSGNTMVENLTRI